MTPPCTESPTPPCGQLNLRHAAQFQFAFTSLCFAACISAVWTGPLLIAGTPHLHNPGNGWLYLIRPNLRVLESCFFLKCFRIHRLWATLEVCPPQIWWMMFEEFQNHFIAMNWVRGFQFMPGFRPDLCPQIFVPRSSSGLRLGLKSPTQPQTQSRTPPANPTPNPTLQLPPISPWGMSGLEG